jgi:CubicO group peptidase (beta-lactamase class C family)
MKISNNLIRINQELQAILKLIDGQLTKALYEKNIPGMSVAIFFDKSIIWKNSYGYSDIELKIPATSRTVFGIGSITKLFTATMLMQLRDQGKLRLDDPVEKYLPGFKIKSRFADSGSITFRQIASHVGGLPSEAPLGYWNTCIFPSITEIMKSLESIELTFPPMTKLKYSNLGYAILGHALESIADTSYVQYVTDHILKPLGMNETCFNFSELDDKFKSQVAKGYIKSRDNQFKVAPYIELNGLTPAGQLYSSVEDICKFISIQFVENSKRRTYHNGNILRPSSTREMHNIQSVKSNWSQGHGIGWTINYIAGHITIGHGGKLPGFTTVIEIMPEIKLGVAIFTNTGIWPYDLSNNILKILIPILDRLFNNLYMPRVTCNMRSEFGYKIVGTYFTESVGKLDLKLINNNLTLIEEHKEPGILVPKNKNEFIIMGGDKDGELVTFNENPLGNVNSLTIGGAYLFIREKTNNDPSSFRHHF